MDGKYIFISRETVKKFTVYGWISLNVVQNTEQYFVFIKQQEKNPQKWVKVYNYESSVAVGLQT